MKTNETKKYKFTKKKIIALVVLIILVIAVTVGIILYLNNREKMYQSSYIYDGTSLYGKWQQYKDFDDKGYIIYEFTKDGATKNGGISGTVIATYYIYGIQATKTESTFRTEGKNTLIIHYSVDGVLQNSKSKFSINDSEILVMKGDENTILQKYNLEYNKDNEIFGEWVDAENPYITYKFNEDYTGEFTDAENLDINGKPNKTKIAYSTKGDTIYMFIDEHLLIKDYAFKPEFVKDLNYKIENGVLTLKIGEKTYTLERKNDGTL